MFQDGRWVFSFLFAALFMASLTLIGCKNNVRFKTGQGDIQRPGEPGATGTPYRRSYELFRSNVQNIFKYRNRNRLAVKNSGDRSVKHLKSLLDMLKEEDREEVQSLADRYMKKWQSIGADRMSIGARRSLKNLGQELISKLSPSRVSVSNSESTVNETRKEDNKPDTTEKKAKSVKVKDREQFQNLFTKWKKLHELYADGLQASDPTLNSTFKSIRDVLVRMKQLLVSDQKKKKLQQYLNRYRAINKQRKQYLGTDQKQKELGRLEKEMEISFSSVRGKEE